MLFCLWVMPATAATTASHATAPITHGAAVPDSQIDAVIHAKLAKSKIGKDGFKYHVQHGVVTWEGTTNVIQHKGSATRMARTAGATQVVNNIQISAGAKAKAMANLKKAQVVQ
jgi:osmotically-inducible protein OsmY